MVSTTADMPSRKQPSTIENTVSAAISASGVSSRPAIQAARLRGNPVKPIASDRKSAPARMSAIMQEVRRAPIRLATKDARVSESCSAERRSDQVTHSKAATVAVEREARREERTVGEGGDSQGRTGGAREKK